MPRPSLPPLTPDQVKHLVDALLANADALLNSAAVLLESGQVALARSLAILGLEESGKAIALHERRVSIAFAPEGEPFVDAALVESWASHGSKLEAVNRFLRDEQYWFGSGPSEPAEDLVLKTIRDWADEKNQHKQRGLYVDVGSEGEPATPQDELDPGAVADVLERVHQIGWQLRLGEHIEGRRLEDHERVVDPATEDELREEAALFAEAGLPPDIVADLLDRMGEGVAGGEVHNVEYTFRFPDPPASPFGNVGKPGYEAQDRELMRLWREMRGAN